MSAHEILGARIDALTLDELSDLVQRRIEEGSRTLIGHHNLHSLYLMDREPALADFARRADCCHVDGMGVIWIAKLLGVPLDREHRVTYADWIWPLMARAVSKRWKVFHLGGKPGVGERAASALRERHPGLAMATRHGYFDPRPESAETGVTLAEIAGHGTDLLMVGMGMPRQERWILENLDRIQATVILVSGACMDYVAGEIATPPRWAGPLGAEWLFRLASEPRRLASRYLLEPWPVLARVVAERWRRWRLPS